MKKFIRENPTIAFGLGLPLLLVLVFLLSSAIPTLLVANPQYDVLYVTDFYNNQSGIQVSVVNNKVEVIYQGSIKNRQKPRIWRYDPKLGAVKEMSFVLPAGLRQKGNKSNTHNQEDVLKSTLIEVPDLEGLEVDSSSIAPDGYEFSVGTDHYSRNVFGNIFYSSRNRHEAHLSKIGRSIRLPNGGGNYYRGTTRFIGWVVSQ